MLSILPHEILEYMIIKFIPHSDIKNLLILDKSINIVININKEYIYLKKIAIEYHKFNLGKFKTRFDYYNFLLNTHCIKCYKKIKNCHLYDKKRRIFNLH